MRVRASLHALAARTQARPRLPAPPPSPLPSPRRPAPPRRPRSDAAREWLSQCSGPEEALAIALAKITGHTALNARSLLTAHEGFTTLQYRQARCGLKGRRRARVFCLCV
jgi:hypothetical protein